VADQVRSLYGVEVNFMGYQLSVSTDDVAAKAGTVAAQVTELESQVATLTTNMQSLSSTWTGSASAAFQDLYQTWKGQAGAIQQSLEAIGVALKAAGSNYDTVETQNTALLRS
jgi:6 kDa early secretory antigenic target